MNFSRKILWAVLLVGTTILLDSCRGRNVTPSDIMVVMDKQSGVLYQIDMSDGSLTELGSFKLDNQTYTGIRDVTYSPDDGLIYGTRNGNSGGEFFSADPSTGVVSVLNDNANGDWDAVPEIVVSGSTIIGTIWAWVPDYGHSLVKFNTNGTVASNHDLLYSNQDPVSTGGGMGLAFASNSTLYIGDYNQMHMSSTEGVVSETKTMSFDGFTSETSDDYYIQSLEVGLDGDLYGLVYHYGSAVLYLARIDFSAGTVTNIVDLTSGNKYHALSVMPPNLF